MLGSSLGLAALDPSHPNAKIVIAKGGPQPRGLGYVVVIAVSCGSGGLR